MVMILDNGHLGFVSMHPQESIILKYFLQLLFWLERRIKQLTLGSCISYLFSVIE